MCGFPPVFAASGRIGSACHVLEIRHAHDVVAVVSLSAGSDGQLIDGPPAGPGRARSVSRGGAHALLFGSSDVERGWEAALGGAGHATIMVNSLRGRRGELMPRPRFPLREMQPRMAP